MTGPFRKFDPTTIKHDRIMVALGMRGSGKTTVMKDICQSMAGVFDVACGVSPTFDSRTFMRNIMPASCVHSSTEVIKPVISQLLDFQKNLLEQRGFSKIHENPKKRLRKVFFMMDDCAYDSKLTKGEIMRELVMNGRHSNIFILNAVQYCVDLPPAFRQNTDYVIAMREPDIDMRKKLFKFYFGIFGDFKKFEKVFAMMTDDYGCMVLDKTIVTTKVEDCVFHYRADMNMKSFQMGSDVIWSFHQKYYKSQLVQNGMLVNVKQKEKEVVTKMMGKADDPKKKHDDEHLMLDETGEKYDREKEKERRQKEYERYEKEKMEEQYELEKRRRAKPTSHKTHIEKEVVHSKPGHQVESSSRRSSYAIAMDLKKRSEEEEVALYKFKSTLGINPFPHIKKWDDHPHQKAYY